LQKGKPVIKAVFLDRDGVINPLVYNPATGEYESPHKPEDFLLYPFAEKSLRLLKDAGFIIIIVSNQPSYAKGKTSLENIKAVEKTLEDFSAEHGGLIDKAFYCYHHPNGIVPEYTRSCACRKPGTLFLEQAKTEFNLDPAQCWFTGDRDSDIECGRRFGCRTIKIDNPHSAKNSGCIEADYHAKNLFDAAKLIVEYTALKKLYGKETDK
jgi:D-glycero-D-manno-heptose 1,7-bisphosphate phosphatase